jgi:Ca2+-binding EF-hand superfamily protein
MKKQAYTMKKQALKNALANALEQALANAMAKKLEQRIAQYRNGTITAAEFLELAAPGVDI